MKQSAFFALVFIILYSANIQGAISKASDKISQYDTSRYAEPANSNLVSESEYPEESTEQIRTRKGDLKAEDTFGLGYARFSYNGLLGGGYAGFGYGGYPGHYGYYNPYHFHRPYRGGYYQHHHHHQFHGHSHGHGHYHHGYHQFGYYPSFGLQAGLHFG